MSHMIHEANGQKNHTTGLAPVEMHPYPRFAVLPPEGEVCSMFSLALT